MSKPFDELSKRELWETILYLQREDKLLRDTIHRLQIRANPPRKGDTFSCCCCGSTDLIEHICSECLHGYSEQSRRLAEILGPDESLLT